MITKKEYGQASLLWVWVVAALVLTGVVFTVVNLTGKQFFGIWNAKIERNIFEESKSQIQGTIQVLNDLKLQYEIADSEGHKSALREAVLSEYSAFKRKDRLPGNLVIFINSL